VRLIHRKARPVTGRAAPTSRSLTMDRMTRLIRSFAIEDDGAQVIEYALIIAVVSIALVIALRGVSSADFSSFIARVNNCLTTSSCS
jgi:pilus assembly protein Flp/PilA